MRRFSQVAIRIVLGILNAAGLWWALTLWVFRLTDRATEHDGPGFVLLVGVLAVIVGAVALALAGVAVKVKWLPAWWAAVPAAILAAAVIGVCSIAGHL